MAVLVAVLSSAACSARHGFRHRTSVEPLDALEALPVLRRRGVPAIRTVDAGGRVVRRSVRLVRVHLESVHVRARVTRIARRAVVIRVLPGDFPGRGSIREGKGWG